MKKSKILISLLHQKVKLKKLNLRLKWINPLSNPN